MQRPTSMTGLRHVALRVKNLAACEHFYTELLGMKVEWRPDPDNVYLTSGNDNLALHRVDESFADENTQHLDHIGFIIASIEEVDHWYQYLASHNVVMKTQPRTHRDGARSFYCLDPDGTPVQIIYHPPIARG